MCLYVGPMSIYYFLMFVQKEYLIPRARGVRLAPTLRGNGHSPRPAIYIEREMCLYVGPIFIYYFLMFVQKEYLIPRARAA